MTTTIKNGITELKAEELEMINGGGFFGDLWDKITGTASGVINALSNTTRIVKDLIDKLF